MAEFLGSAAGIALLKALAPLLSVFFNALGKSFDDYLAGKRAEQAQRDLGSVQTTSTINKESADAERRANQVAANRPDVSAVIDGLQRGDEF